MTLTQYLNSGFNNAFNNKPNKTFAVNLIMTVNDLHYPKNNLNNIYGSSFNNYFINDVNNDFNYDLSKDSNSDFKP